MTTTPPYSRSDARYAEKRRSATRRKYARTKAQRAARAAERNIAREVDRAARIAAESEADP